MYLNELCFSLPSQESANGTPRSSSNTSPRNAPRSLLTFSVSGREGLPNTSICLIVSINCCQTPQYVQLWVLLPNTSICLIVSIVVKQLNMSNCEYCCQAPQYVQLWVLLPSTSICPTVSIVAKHLNMSNSVYYLHVLFT